MGLVKEPLNVDFYVDPRPLSTAKKALISEHIRKQKAKAVKRKKSKASYRLL
jgi:hypothetical protein